MARQPNPIAQLASQAQQSRGFPPGFKAYSSAPFAGMNVQDAPFAIDDKEFIWIENWIRTGGSRLRTAWDKGVALYTAPTGKKIVSFFFFTIGSDYFCAVFLDDGSGIHVDIDAAVTIQMAPAGTFYDASSGQLPACVQWGVLYLLISNRNTPNDFWAWDGVTLFQAGSSAPDSVALASGGENYTSAPTVTAFGGTGHGMTFTATVQGGNVIHVKINNPGTGYGVGDVVQLAFSGGGSNRSAQLKANLNAGGVVAATITDAGVGYTHASVSFSGGGGSGAAGTVTIGSGVDSITMTNTGANYSYASVALTGGGGAGCIVETVIVGGQVVGIDILAPGTGYTGVPGVVISGDGAGATATAQIQNGQITGINVTSPGSGYNSAPSVLISGDGASATAQAVLGGTSISGVDVLNGGTGFTAAPALTFVGGGGTGAVGVAVLTPTSIAKVNLVSGGANYSKPPTVSFTDASNGPPTGSGATAVAVMAGGSVVAVNVTNAGSGYTTNLEVVFTNQTSDKTGAGAGATVVFAPTSIASVTMSNYGTGYTDAPAVLVQPGSNHAAYAEVALMPFGVSGASMEAYQQRLWIADPAPALYATQPPGGNWQVSAPGSFTDFATSLGGVLFTNLDSFLQTQYTNIRQSNGYLYFFGDGSVSVVSSVNTSGNPSTTTFSYENTDPQSGLSWRDSLQAFSRSLLAANETGVFALYGGAMTKVSGKLDSLFNNALFPPNPLALTPSSSIATLFDIKHYLMLATVIDPAVNAPRNVMLTWNEKDWSITSQTVDLTYIGPQKIGSVYKAWGTDGTSLYPLFEKPSSALVKRLDTKFYGGENPLMIKDVFGLWMTAQDQSVGLSGIDCNVTFTVSGIAIQGSTAAPNVNLESVGSLDTGLTGLNLLIEQPKFQAPPPFWPVFGTGSGGATFMSAGARIITSSPDFTLGNLVLAYQDQQAFF